MQMPRNTQWRRVLALDLGLFNIAIFFFAWLPPSTLTIQEYIIMMLAVIGLFGVISHSVDSIKVPGDHWAYLVTGFAGFLTLLAYEIFAQEKAIHVRVSFGLFLLSGIVSAYAAHVIDGGKREGRV